jgi:hypothetical protein
MERTASVGSTNVTAQLAFRTSPVYINLVDRLAAELDISTGTLLRKSVEHFAATACPQVEKALVRDLLEVGSTVRNNRRRQSRRLSTLAAGN